MTGTPQACRPPGSILGERQAADGHGRLQGLEAELRLSRWRHAGATFLTPRLRQRRATGSATCGMQDMLASPTSRRVRLSRRMLVVGGVPARAARACAAPAAAQRIENSVAVFAALDKVTARISRLEVPLGQTASSARSRSRRAPAIRARPPSRPRPQPSSRSTRSCSTARRSASFRAGCSPRARAQRGRASGVRRLADRVQRQSARRGSAEAGTSGQGGSPASSGCRAAAADRRSTPSPRAVRRADGWSRRAAASANRARAWMMSRISSGLACAGRARKSARAPAPSRAACGTRRGRSRWCRTASGDR